MYFTFTYWEVLVHGQAWRLCGFKLSHWLLINYAILRTQHALSELQF